MKKILLILMLITMSLFAQDKVDYYGKTGSPQAYKLVISVDDSLMANEYIPSDQLIGLQVDSNWTESGMAFKVYNYLENSWDLLYDADVLVEYAITPGQAILVDPRVSALLSSGFKVVKMTSGAYVVQADTSTGLIVRTCKFLN